MATLSELRTRVTDYLGQPIDDSGRLTTTRVDRAINDGYVDFVKRTRCMNRTVTLEAVEEQAAYTIPLDFTSLTRVLYGTTELTPSTYDILSADRPLWQEEDAGTPDTWYRSSSTKISVVPAPSVDTTDFTLYGDIVPSSVSGGTALLSGASDVPGLPAAFHHALALYAVYELAAHLFSGDVEIAASGKVAFAEYELMVRDLIASMVLEGAFV